MERDPPHRSSTEDEDVAWREVVLDAWRRGQHLGAVGPGDLVDHLRHATALAQLLARDARDGVDLGTGVGIPGLALAGLRPDMAWNLVDAARRRVTVVEDAVAALGWSPRVRVVHARAEDLPGAVWADVVVARSFGPPATTAECAAPLVRVGGQVLVTEPPTGAMRWSVAGLAPLGLRLGARHRSPAVQVLDAVAPPEERFPRKPGVARKRPLW